MGLVSAGAFQSYNVLALGQQMKQTKKKHDNEREKNSDFFSLQFQSKRIMYLIIAVVITTTTTATITKNINKLCVSVAVSTVCMLWVCMQCAVCLYRCVGCVKKYQLTISISRSQTHANLRQCARKKWVYFRNTKKKKQKENKNANNKKDDAFRLRLVIESTQPERVCNVVRRNGFFSSCSFHFCSHYYYRQSASLIYSDLCLVVHFIYAFFSLIERRKHREQHRTPATAWKEQKFRLFFVHLQFNSVIPSHRDVLCVCALLMHKTHLVSVSARFNRTIHYLV